MRLGRAGTNDEIIGEGGNAAQIDDDDVFSLFVRGELGARVR
jgi:hypothetical protein